MYADMPSQTIPSAQLASQEAEQLLRLHKDILEAVALGEDPNGNRRTKIFSREEGMRAATGLPA